MFYSLVRSYIGFREAQKTAEAKRSAREKQEPRDRVCGFRLASRFDQDNSGPAIVEPVVTYHVGVKRRRTDNDVIKVVLEKGENIIGISIVGLKGKGQRHSGIYIQAVIVGTPADKDGQLEIGDQLLAVDSQSLLDVSQEEAAALLSQPRETINLLVSKGAAKSHGLKDIIAQSTMNDIDGLLPRT